MVGSTEKFPSDRTERASSLKIIVDSGEPLKSCSKANAPTPVMLTGDHQAYWAGVCGFQVTPHIAQRSDI